MKDVRKQKQLQTQLNTAKADAEVLKVEIGNKQRELAAKQRIVERIQAEINKLNDGTGIRVSEHAMLRYLERVKGLDLTELEGEILNDEAMRLIAVLGGSGKYPNGVCVLVMKDNTVTTITV